MLSVILIGISLSMDAFAVSVTNGIAMRPFKTGYALWHGLYFGAFQFLMPLAGYILGSTVSGYVTAIGPYVSFALLAFIGGKMILEAVRGGEDGSGGAHDVAGTHLGGDGGGQGLERAHAVLMPPAPQGQVAEHLFHPLAEAAHLNKAGADGVPQAHSDQQENQDVVRQVRVDGLYDFQ